MADSEWITVAGDEPKVERTTRYFAELRASLKNALDVTSDVEWLGELNKALNEQNASLVVENEQLRDEVAAYTASMVAHHDIANLSDAAITESLGSPCQICARAQAERRRRASNRQEGQS